MTFSRVLTFSLRYLRGHLRRYLFLLIAVSFGFAIITLMTALSDGMSASVARAARQHYAGDLFVMGIDADKGRFKRVTETEAVTEAVKEAGLGEAVQVKRTFTSDGAILHFAGNASRQKYLYGVDWGVEAEDLKGLDFISGGAPGESDSRAILVSRPIAEVLGVHSGDSLILEVRTLGGQVNTGTFIVRGIFNDPSIFGYFKTYVNRRYLNSLVGLEPEAYSALGLYLPERTGREEAASRLYHALNRRLPTAPAIYDKDEFTVAAGGDWEGIRYFVVPLEMYISEVDDLLSAMNITSYTVFVMIVLIVLVSVTVTYKLVIHERTREIGTLRALGMPKRTLRGILMSEAAYLFFISLTAGFILSLLLLGATRLLPFDWIPGFEIFTRNGRLVGSLRLKTIGINAFIMLLIVVPAALIPVVNASELTLTESLNSD